MPIMYLFYLQIDIDFNIVHPNCPDLKLTLDIKYDKILKLLDDQIKDNGSREIFRNLKENMSADISGSNN